MDSSIFSLTDRVAIVTGSGRGIGKAIALCLADFGANIVVAERAAESMESTSAEIRAKGRKALPVEVDLRDSQQVAGMVSRTLNELGRIDILVNNVGGNFRHPFLEYTERGWDTIFQENLKSVFLPTHAVGKIMVEQKKGCVVNISSSSGIRPGAQVGPYSAAKAAVINLTTYLAVEWAPYNIRVNSVAPGTTLTPGVAEVYQKNPEAMERRIKRVPLGRLGQPEDIAKAVLFFASDASSYITGQILLVDGGWLSTLD